MQDYEANRIIIQRQSLDWSAENYSDRGAAENFAYAILPENCVEERVALADATLELIELWNSVFDIRFHTCRAKIKEIAHINWREVNQCDEIWYDFNFDQIRSKFMGETVVALFTDDDDWFAPDVFSQLNEATSQSSAKGWLWKRSKFDGTLSSTELGDPLYAFTNNYALDGRMFDKGSSVKKNYPA
jgi:oligoribonuclease NrnB/cAMP/cGMP phosphodiesterase (DHH superfamily)